MGVQQCFQPAAQFGVGGTFAVEECLAGRGVGQVEGGGEQFFAPRGSAGMVGISTGISLISAKTGTKESHEIRLNSDG